MTASAAARGPSASEGFLQHQHTVDRSGALACAQASSPRSFSLCSHSLFPLRLRGSYPVLVSQYDTYQSPLAARNASPEMLRIWSPRHKFNTWRRIWLAVAEAQQACGLDITDEQIAELRTVVERGITDKELDRASEIEKELRHDVMAHVHCLAEQCPKAKPILHLGMTSQDVVCNADLIAIYEATCLIENKINRVMVSFGVPAAQWMSLPTLGFTHYQPAQPTTVGRRAAFWAMDLRIASRLTSNLFDTNSATLRGFRGATGTQASFLALFDGKIELVDEFDARAINLLLSGDEIDPVPSLDDAKRIRLESIEHLEHLIRYGNERRAAGEKMKTGYIEGQLENLHRSSAADVRRDRINFIIATRSFDLTGQTYPRVFDTQILSTLASIASVLHKIATDIRLLVNHKELDEPFGDKQVGSSAMPYKCNPMRCERICGLTRFVMNLVGNAYDTAATQWLERTLDDSSNRRLSLPESFLALDGALDLMHNVASGLVVHEAMVRRNLMAELPFLATENILMEAVKLGGDRQDLHEKIRVHAQLAGSRVKNEGLDNDLLQRLQADPAFAAPALKSDLNWDNLMDPMRYIGRSVEQTERFIKEVVEPLRERYADELEGLSNTEPRV